MFWYLIILWFTNGMILHLRVSQNPRFPTQAVCKETVELHRGSLTVELLGCCCSMPKTLSKTGGFNLLRRKTTDVCENGKETVSSFHLWCWKGTHLSLVSDSVLKIIGDKGPIRVPMISSGKVLRNAAMSQHRLLLCVRFTPFEATGVYFAESSQNHDTSSLSDITILL